MSNGFDELYELQDKLRALASRVPDDDVKTIRTTLEYLGLLGVIQRDLTDLTDTLEEIDEQYNRDSADFPEQLQRIEIASSTLALKEVSRFLRIRYWSESIDRLEAALSQLIMGGPPAAMFQPQNVKGRRPDVPAIQ